MVNVLVVGSGGREHALSWKLSQSELVDEVYVAPGNGGTSQNIPISVDDIDALANFAQEKSCFTVVGPEAPLANGLVDKFIEKGLAVFGPSKQAAQLESSKIWAKEFMKRNDIPTADFEIFDDAQKAKEFVSTYEKQVVIKADGLAAGKGVIVCSNNDEANDAIDKILVKSKYHRELFPGIPDDKFKIIPNGILSKEFKTDLCRDPNLIISTSSADRCISSLLKGFKIIKESCPEAKLMWAYGFGALDTDQDPDIKKWVKEVKTTLKNTSDFYDMGRMNQQDIISLYKKANIFAYPTEFAEIDCISLTKAMAGGAYPVTTAVAALVEKQSDFGTQIDIKEKTKTVKTVDYGLQSDHDIDQWAQEVIHIFKNSPTEHEREKMKEYARNKYDWKKIASEWEMVLR